MSSVLPKKRIEYLLKGAELEMIHGDYLPTINELRELCKLALSALNTDEPSPDDPTVCGSCGEEIDEDVEAVEMGRGRMSYLAHPLCAEQWRSSGTGY